MNQQSTKEKKQLYKCLYAIGASMMFSARKAMDGCDTISADAFLCDTNLKYDKTLEDYIIQRLVESANNEIVGVAKIINDEQK